MTKKKEDAKDENGWESPLDAFARTAEGGSMTQQQREKLIFCTGVLAGLSWLVESDAVANALNSVQEDIDRMLKEYADENA